MAEANCVNLERLRAILIAYFWRLSYKSPVSNVLEIIPLGGIGEWHGRPARDFFFTSRARCACHIPPVTSFLRHAQDARATFSHTDPAPVLEPGFDWIAWNIPH